MSKLTLSGLSNFCGASFRPTGVLINVADTFYILTAGLINAMAGDLSTSSENRFRESFTRVWVNCVVLSALCEFETTDRTSSKRETKVSSDLVQGRLRENERVLRVVFRLSRNFAV